jgi:hypothetical protein
MYKFVTIKCPYGFGNQLRLLLVANHLVKEKILHIAMQDWVVNNHNIVNFDNFFNPLPNVLMKKIQDKNVMLTNSSYTSLLKRSRLEKRYSVKKSLQLSFSDLSLKDTYLNIINNYIYKFNIPNAIGVHIRTGCKTALLNENPDREKPIPQDMLIEILKNTDDYIYLATDNAETQDKFLNIFKDRILFFEKLTEGNEKFEGKYTEEKVKRFTSDLSVIADFYILQKCKLFLGSNESTFSLMIHYLRDNPLDYPIHGKL